MEMIPVQVEADVSDGMPQFTMVGYVSAQVKEAQDRVRTALKNMGISLPPKRITINLSPADVRDLHSFPTRRSSDLRVSIFRLQRAF